MLIVKVQLSLASTHKHRRVLIYNESGSICWEGDAARDLIRACNNSAKTYWYAHMDGTEVVLETRAPEQDW